MIALLLLTALAGVALAETEVSGEVSGEWTVEGSPYIVVDSTWVPEGDTLILRAGVEVKFNEDQGLYVWGRLNTTGDEEDSVYIRVNEGVEHWRGLRFYGRNWTQWNYASIVCPDSAFVLDPGYSLTMNNCLLDADRTFAGDTYYGARGCNFTFSQSVIRSRSHHTATGGRLIASHTLFDFGEDEDDTPGFRLEGTSCRLTRCEVIGVLYAENGGNTIVDSCRFLRTPLGRRTGVGIQGPQGRMTESYVEGGVGIGYPGATVHFANNTLLGNLSLSGGVNVLGCNIGGLLNIHDGESIQICNSIVGKALIARFVNSLNIDSCFFVRVDTIYDNHLSVFDVSHLMITRCILSNMDGISLTEVDSGSFDHNTIVFDSVDYAGIHASANSYWTNNIFITVVPGGRLFSQYTMPSFDFNCVWGFEIAAGPPYDPLPIDEIDSSNVITDPLIEWDSIFPNLSLDSPCIDRGDPQFALDPDSSRSDIGAIAFDRRLYVSRPTDGVRFPTLLNVTAYPNPFNNYLNVSFFSPELSPVSVTLFDVSGRNISQTRRAPAPSGSGLVSLSATSLPSGNYVVLVRTAQYTEAVSVYCIK